MIIQTKYNIGEKVWGNPNGNIIKMSIARIYVKVHKERVHVSYEFDDIDDTGRTYRLEENMVFSNREECAKKCNWCDFF